MESTMIRLLKDQFKDNLRLITNKIEEVNVDHLSHTNQDYELFKNKGEDLGFKSKIPDDEDFRILLYTKQESENSEVYIVSNDHVFTKNIKLIAEYYKGTVIPEERL